MRSMALVLAFLMIGVLLWVLFSSDKISILVNGQLVPGPFDAMIGLGSFLLATVIIFCVAILLVFVVAGIGVLILGVFVFVGAIMFAVFFPILLPVLIPLLIIWLFVAMLTKSERSNK